MTGEQKGRKREGPSKGNASMETKPKKNKNKLKDENKN
jgi:hypothetical protein